MVKTGDSPHVSVIRHMRTPFRGVNRDRGNASEKGADDPGSCETFRSMNRIVPALVTRGQGEMTLSILSIFLLERRRAWRISSGFRTG